jgi:TP901 family phage tail tape measure protein
MAKEIKFNIKLTVDGKEQVVTATSDLNEMQKSISRIRSAASDMRDALISFNQGFEVLRNVSSTFNDLTEESRSFGAAMNAANTMAGKNGEDFAKLKDQVAGLAKAVPVAREELANGLYQVISNSVPEDNWIKFLQKSARASVGGIADLGETVKVTSTVIKNYGLSWDAAGDIQDKIQLTAKNGVTSFEQLAQALPRVTGNAATLGVSIDELMATFSTLTGVSGNTAEVSTQLAAVFTALVKPSSEASKMAEQMGISFNAASIKAAGGLQNFLADLDKNVKQYAQKSGMLEQEIYGKLFGSAESLRAIGPLTGQLADKFNENISSMKDSAGTIDEAFLTMSNSGAASFQMMKNKLAEFTDGITSAMNSLMPVLNMAAQVGSGIIAITTLSTAVKKLAQAHLVLKVRTIASNAASVMWSATSVRMNAIVRVMSANFRGAAVSATTLKLAMQGLLISTGVGIAVVALTEAISAFCSKSSEAKNKASEQAEAMKEMNSAADEVKNAYDSTLKSTYSELMSKYDKLKEGWKSLSTEQQKVQWIKDNKDAFGELGLKISGLSDAENAFSGNTQNIVESFERRAKAAAYAAKLVELYKRQLDLKKRSKAVDKAINDATAEFRKDPTFRDSGPYAAQEEKKRVGIAAVGTDLKHGGDGNIEKLKRDLNDVNTEIDEAKDALQTLKKEDPAKAVNIPAVNTANTTNTPSAVEPKTYIEKLQAQLSAAQKTKDNALSIEARVEADAKVKKIQAEIDEATKGKVSIEAATEPTYIVAGSAADKRKSYSNAQQRIGNIRQDYDSGLIDKASAQKAIADINDQLSALGMKPIEVHFKTPIEELQEQLQNAQRSLDEAATIEAKVKASAKIAEIQAEIDRATKGKVSIAAEVEPEYIEQGSVADKRQSYSNAQQKASRIQSDFEIGIIGKDEAMKQLEDLDAELTQLGLKPLKIDIKTSDIDDAKKKMEGACSAASAMGSSLSSLGNAIGVPELNVAGVLAQSIAVMTEGFATATAQAATLGPWAWIGFAATGIAQLAAMISAMKNLNGFASGGVVGGGSTFGDRKFARVNSGEMILTKWQQARLFQMINTPRYTPPIFTQRTLPDMQTAQTSRQSIDGIRLEIGIKGKTRGTELEQTISNVRRIAAKSGRRSNLS